VVSLLGEVGEPGKGAHLEESVDEIERGLLAAYKVEAEKALPWLNLQEGETVCQGLAKQGYEPRLAMRTLLEGLSREVVQNQLEEIIEAEVDIGKSVAELISTLKQKVHLLEKYWLDGGHA
jgi:hypothetical protein